MRQIIIVTIITALLLCVLPLLPAREQHLWGHIRITAADIYTEAYTDEQPPTCGCCYVLWGGGRVTVKTSLASVAEGDMVYLRGLYGEHIVVECVEILPWYGWLMDTDGDILIRDGWRVYRCIRL